MAFHEKGRLGVIMGIEGNMPAYRVMDRETRELHRIPFAQTVSHEGHFPLGDKADGSDEGPVAYLDEDAIDLVPWRLFRTRPTVSAPTPAPKVMAPVPLPAPPFFCANAPGSRNRCNAGDTCHSSYANPSSTLEGICGYTHEPAGGRQTKL